MKAEAEKSGKLQSSYELPRNIFGVHISSRDKTTTFSPPKSDGFHDSLSSFQTLHETVK